MQMLLRQMGNQPTTYLSVHYFLGSVPCPGKKAVNTNNMVPALRELTFQLGYIAAEHHWIPAFQTSRQNHHGRPAG